MVTLYDVIIQFDILYAVELVMDILVFTKEIKIWKFIGDGC
jgi:hypothetical protein